MSKALFLGLGGVLIALTVGIAALKMSTEPTRTVRPDIQDAVDVYRSEKDGAVFERGPGISKVIEEHELDVYLQSQAGPLVSGPDPETLARANAAKLKAEEALKQFQALQRQELAQIRSALSE